MAKLTDVKGGAQSGTYSSVVPALVTDNVDPDELGRVKVKFPTLQDEPVSFWLRVSSPNAGKERGLYSLPEVDDEVLVTFMQGSQDVGVILGQMWNGKDKPPKEAGSGMPGSSKTDTGGKLSTAKPKDGSSDIKKNDRRLWRSRSGHLFVFDDSSGKETVQIWDKSLALSLVFDTSSSCIFLANSKGDIHIRTKKDLYLEAGQNVKWKAGMNYEGECGQDAKVKAGMNMALEAGMDYKLKAGMNAKIEAGMNFEAKASMAAKIEGSMTFDAKAGLSGKLDGGAMATIKGGIVMIN